ncbi:hydroxyethylthiazole kinase [Branchiibius hedensis]|uniref:Hydroxyethylthiazole kinase n=1 Tax=Branchiibius hedensis TaxID=672460 RepID=A0A2Y9BU76_9MICO|nr:hydroxyethylthiazole kinase [Branchiibius hedensis]PWJ26450.1 hydroxyethylthiazole kinase [Branchiibius hedensis]SSA35262.1 hydroxyethylthiazole kinase [Branchiibius hedensis]
MSVHSRTPLFDATPPPGEALSRLRSTRPLTQCITNAVVTNFTANVLLALGATPAMTDVPTEAGPFAAIADGVLINLGTPHAEQRAAAREVPPATRRWVLDPVAVGSLPVRTALAAELLDQGPAIIRGNPSEILALAGAGTGGRGVDSIDTPDAAAEVAVHLARRSGAVVAVSGPIDLVTDGDEVVRVHGGDALLTLVTGGGCSLGATMAAFLGVAAPLTAAVTASLVHAVASETAARNSHGPGSFTVAFLDALCALDPTELDAEGRLTRGRTLVAGGAR